MASLLCPTSATLQQNHRILCFSPLKSISRVNNFSFTKRLEGTPGRCNALFGSIPDDLLEQSLSQFPTIKSEFTGELTDAPSMLTFTVLRRAEFLGSFVADQNNSQFIKGGKWLVWKYYI
ncbi:hypothetical protein F3Y22_tig00000778pilonHSYRG00028 [Hibiscus syriacus]|uniref:Uncharacterized protein n=1 Tax=Hibiscus syriacus TaxID=106335 RepID=A0A6A3D470_HIBSY|nr:hypothetical protein F3Y22_tig00000778pilonHSYRG00028 [Hibiscus syriacus]